MSCPRQPIPRPGERFITRPVALETLIEHGLADQLQAVRRVAADGVVQHRAALPDVGELAQRLAQDRSRAVRERGEFLLRQASSAE